MPVILGDDNWLGSMTSTYTLIFSVEYAPNATIIAPVEDKSHKGANISKMDLSGGVTVSFDEPMYMNPKYTRRLLQESTNGTNQTNTTWVIY